MKKFLDFVKQALLGKGEGVASLKKLSPEEIIKIGIDQGIGEKEAIAIFNAVKNGQADSITKELVTSLDDTKALMSTDDMIEQELRAEYIDGKGADYLSFDEFKLSKQPTAEDLIGPEGFPPTAMSREQQIAISVQADIDKVAKATGLSPDEARAAIMEKMNEGYEIGDPKRRGLKDLSNMQAYLETNLNYSPTDAAMFMEDIEDIAFGGAIDLASDTAKNVSKQNAKQIINSSNPGAEFGETLMDFADPNYDKLVNEGFYVEGSMKPGPAHPFNNPEKAITANLVPDAEGSLTSKVVLNIAQWKRELIKNLEEGIITRAEYDELYRNADQVFDTIYNTAKSTDMSKGFVVGSADNPNAEKVLTDYWPGENYAAKYITEEEIAGTGFKMTDEQITESNFKNSETLDLMEQILEDAKTTNKIVTSQTDELQMYNALLDDARDAGDFMEEERIIDILKDAKAQTESGTELPNLIFNDSKRSLNAMGGIIQGVKNRGK